jgi:hypothetical protein
MFGDEPTIYSLDAPEFELRPTGILDGRGRMIFSKPVVGFSRQLYEYVVQENSDKNRKEY